MEYMKRFEPVALFLVIVGALTWAILALTDTNVLAEIFGDGTVLDVVYVVVGVAGLTFVPRLLDELHIGTGRPHARGV
jgi:uncharacterized membrane protein YuzA (DUF378 family)